MVTQIGDGGGELSSLVDGVFVDADHEGSGIAQGFFDFEVEAFVDDAFYGAWRYSKFAGNGFVVNVFDVFMCDGLPEAFTGSFFGKESFYGFTEEMGAVWAFVAFGFDDQNPPGSLFIHEEGSSGVMIVEF